MHHNYSTLTIKLVLKVSGVQDLNKKNEQHLLVFFYITLRKIANGNRRMGRISSHIFARKMCNFEQSTAP